LEFLPWSAYINLTYGQKRTIFDEQLLWNFNFKSIVCKGFKDNKYSAIIVLHNTNKNGPRKLEVLTATEYLSNLEHPITHKKMFDYIYLTLSNCREQVVSFDVLIYSKEIATDGALTDGTDTDGTDTDVADTNVVSTDVVDTVFVDTDVTNGADDVVKLDSTDCFRV
jgi:hypothetical protein